MGSEKGGVGGLGLGVGVGEKAKRESSGRKLSYGGKHGVGCHLENLEAKSGRCPFEDKIADVTFHIIRRRH